MESLNLTAAPRPLVGKGVARKARKAGRTPGIVYRAGGTATPVSFDVAALATIFRKTADPNTLINLTMEGEGDHLCLIRDIQRDPLSRNVIHVDFYEVTPDYVVSVDVAVTTSGRAAGTRLGGTLRVLTRTLRVQCAASKIPRNIDLDVSPLEVGQFLKVSQIPAIPGVKVIYQQDFNLVTVEGKRTERAEEGAPAAGAPAAAVAPAKAAGKPAKA